MATDVRGRCPTRSTVRQYRHGNAPIGTIFSVYPASPAGDRFIILFRRGAGRCRLRHPGQHGVAADGRRASTCTCSTGRTITGASPPACLSPRAQNMRSTRRTIVSGASLARLISTIVCWRRRAAQPRLQHALARLAGRRDAHRILQRGGVYLYPADRPRLRAGRLRLVTKRQPIAYLVEQAGGAATDGLTPILDGSRTASRAPPSASVPRPGRTRSRAISHRSTR